VRCARKEKGMKKQQVTIYICGLCGKESKAIQEIAECEKLHLFERKLESVLSCTKFEVTEQHLKLLQQQNVKFNRWTEYGATEIDPKRPYGNSDVDGDILKIIGRQGDIDEGDGSFSCSQKLSNELYFIHVETVIALQICLQFTAFETGQYRRDGTWSDWEKCGDTDG
jgi:hypothetical protein